MDILRTQARQTLYPTPRQRTARAFDLWFKVGIAIVTGIILVAGRLRVNSPGLVVDLGAVLLVTAAVIACICHARTWRERAARRIIQGGRV